MITRIRCKRCRWFIEPWWLSQQLSSAQRSIGVDWIAWFRLHLPNCRPYRP